MLGMCLVVSLPFFSGGEMQVGFSTKLTPCSSVETAIRDSTANPGANSYGKKDEPTEDGGLSSTKVLD